MAKGPAQVSLSERKNKGKIHLRAKFHLDTKAATVGSKCNIG